LPCGAAECWWKHVDVGGRSLKKIDILGVNNRLYEGDVRMFYEHGQRPAQHGFATDRPELLGQIATRARSASGRHDDCCNARHAMRTPDFGLDFGLD
jgi:hypothetical protein